MPGMNFNRNKRPDNGASRRGLLHSRLAQRAIAIVGALALVVAGIGTFTMTAQADPHPINKDIVADNSTLGNWSGEVGIDNTTENVGRIWTDKTVQADNIELSGGDAGSITINKGSSDFLVGLSALSSMSNTVTTSSTPLDIVLVLDMSGSMDDPIDYDEVYDLQTGNNRPDYFVLVNGEYVEITRVNRGSNRNPRYEWGYSTRQTWHTVNPKTSADSWGDQVYVAGTSKVDALKTAVNQFIDTTNQANGTMPDDSKHEISIVKFAGEMSNQIGNRKYEDDNGYTQNYSQVVTNFTSNSNALKSYVNNLDPDGATRADYGMELAQRVIDGNTRYGLDGARENSKRVVIFFTDGQPTESNTWSSTVANSAIGYARQMKTDETDPVTIYSIGVFEDADPTDATDNSFNGYMNAVSSNYPNARGYIGQTGMVDGYWQSANMGDRAPDSNYYMAATSSTELDDIFQQISEEIGSGTGAPTQTGGKDTETTSGYITITDQLGAYMKFDGMKEVVFAGQPFYQVGEATEDTDPDYSGWLRYNFEGEANSDIYPTGNLNQLIIRVKPGSDLATGDTVQVQIPASLIPTRYFDVDATNKTMSVTDTYPIRIFYGVSLKSYVADSIAAGAPMGTLTQDEYNALDTYVKNNQYTKGEGDDSTAYARFYSNAYSSGADGTTISSFEPSDGNEFYYFTKNTTIYSDKDCTNPVKSQNDIQDGQSYYYKNTFWQFKDPDTAKTNGTKYPAEETFTPFELTAAQARQIATGQDADGNVYIPQGTRHMAMISQIVTNKVTNPTGTATSVIKPNWAESGNGETIDATLGNNGRLGIELPGTLSVTKHIEVPTGVDETQFADTAFPFQINMNADTVGGYTFKAQVKNADGTIANPSSGEGYFDLEFDDRGHSAEVNLKPDQTLTLYGLGDGWEYGVTENDTLPGFKLTDPANGLAQGKIDQAAPAQVEFTNTYSFDDNATITGSVDLTGTKTLTPRAWQNGDHFEFELMVAEGSTYADGTSVPTEAQPMPETTRVTLTNEQAQGAAADTPVKFNFGDIKYTAPGTYNYIIREVSYNDGEAGGVAGVTYDPSRYSVQVVVTDDGHGKLSAEATMRTLDQQDHTGQMVDTAAFTNTWSATEASVMIEGVKNFRDTTRPGVTTATPDDFFFRITAENGGPLPVPDAANNVVRDQGDDYVVVTTLPAGMVQFGNATFTDDMVDNTYKYSIEEVVKQDDSYVPVSEAIEANDAGAYVQNGMTYDATKWTLEIAVTADGDQVRATPTYSGGTLQDGSFAFTNSYDPADATLTGNAAIHGTKTLTGRDMTENESFTFTLAGADTATTTAMTDGTITFGGQSLATYTQNVSGAVEDTATGFNFGGMVINKDGTYTFSMSETGYTDGTDSYAGTQLDNRINGITFDRDVYTVTVTVTDENGQLNATVAYSTENGEAAFTNRYTARTTYGPGTNLTVAKTLTGRDMKVDDFTFEIAATGDNDEAAQAKLTDAGIGATFTNPQAASSGVQSTWQILSNLAFNQDDAGKTFTYQVKEQIPDEADRHGVTYDDSVYEVAIQVVDNANGTMHTVTTVKRGDEQIGTFDSSQGTVTPTLTFANNYKGAPVTADPETSTYLQLYKVVTGRSWLERDSFTFTMTKVSYNGETDADALAVMPNPGNDGEVTLGGTAQAGTKAGQSVPFNFGSMTFTEAGTYVYRVDETNDGNDGQGLTYDEHTVDLTIVINDNGEGNLVVGPVYPTGSRTFTNNYTAEVNYADAVATLSAQKTLNGHAMAEDQFEFTVTPDDEASAKKVGLWDDDQVQSKTLSWGAGADGEQVNADVDLGLIFTQADSGKIFTYTFAEVVPEQAPAGYDYDGTTYTVAITPTDNLDGTMSVKTVVTTKPAEGDETTDTYTYNTGGDKANIVLPFVNTYGANATTGDVAADVKATKTLTGRDMTAGEFNFEIVTRKADSFDGEFTEKTVATGTNAEAAAGVAGDVTFTDGDGDAMTYTIDKLDQAVTEGYATKTVDETTGNATWTLNYTAREDTSALPNKVSATGTTSFDFTVEVKDDGEGNLTATVNGVPQDGFAFQNTYTPDSVTVGTDGAAQIVVQKTFTGRPGNAWLEGDSFEFTIAGEGGAPMPENDKVVISSKSNPENGVATGIFGNITYKKSDLGGAMSKDFVYDITETGPKDSGNGITKDGHTAQVTVTITDNENGQLEATVTYDNDDATTAADQAVDNAAAFTNTYNAGTGTLVGEDYLKASKTLTGRDWLAGEQVNLVLAGDAGTPAPEGATETDEGWQYALTFDANEELSFPNIAYTASDLDDAASKTFEYTIFEDAGSHNVKDGSEADIAQIHQGMDYSEAGYTVTVTVADNEKGALTVTPAMVQTQDDNGGPVDNAAVDVAAFTNVFNAHEDTIQLAATKNYSERTGGNPIEDDMFTFMVKPVGDEAATAPMDDNLVAEGTTGADRYIAAGVKVDAGETPTADFGTAHFNFDGHNHTFYYEVVEALNIDGTWTPVAEAIDADETGAYVQDGVTYDPSTFTAKVEVTYDDEHQASHSEMTLYKGTYDEVSKASEDELADMKVDGITFNNSYGTGGTTVDTGDATTTASFTKVIDGRDWLGSDSFQFTITPQGDAPAFEGAGNDGVKTVNVTDANDVIDKITDADGQEVAVNGRSFNFGSVTFTDDNMEGAETDPKTDKLTKKFTYTVAEVQPEEKIPGMTYDGHTATLTITVVDNGDGTMTATPQVQNSVFTNTYSTSVDGAAFGGFQITKTLTGHAMTDGQFEFTVTPVDGTGTSAADAAAKLGITDGSKTVASPAANDGEQVTVGTFGLADGMTFTQADADKTFAYEVIESKGGDKGYTNDGATYRVEVAVAHDPATATLTVTTTVTKDGEQVGEPIVVTNASTDRAVASVDFQNSYAASTDPGDGGTPATVSTTKTLDGRPLEAGEFTFQVAYAGGDQAVVKSDVTNAADGTVDFGSFEYDTASLAQMVKDRYATITNVDEDGNATWMIQYTASELTDGLSDVGVSASKASFDFTITVVDNGNGSLTATAELPENAGFTNTYSSTSEGGDPSVQMTPSGSKVIEAADGLTPNYNELVGKFTFTLSSDDPNAPMPEQTTATNDKDGNVTFGAIEFTLDDLNKALGTQDDAAEGDEGIDTQAVGGTPREYTFTYKVTESGSAAGITNDPNPVREFSYTVHDNGQGTLTVTSDPADATLFTFTNTYSVEPVESSPTGEGQLTITKTLTGRDMAEGEFTFVLTAPDGFTAPDGSTQFTATNAAAADGEAGAVTFAPITFTEQGTYEFTLEEQAGADNVGVGYDLDTYTITANVTDNGVGGLEVTWRANGMGDSKEIDFQNTYEAAPASMGFGATKVLTGRDLTDGEFSFQVTDETGEKVYAVAKNDATGTVSFDPITFKQAGEYHLWISEVLPEDDDAATDGIQSERVTYDETRYELVVTVADDGKGQLQVTNVAMADGSEPAPVFQNTYTKPEEPQEPAKPVLPGGGTLEQTGDTMPLLLGVATVAGVALVAGGLAVRRKRGE